MPDQHGNHAMLCASEWQFKVLTLLKVSNKTTFKQTAPRGCPVDHPKICLFCLTDMGIVHIFPVPGLRPQVYLLLYPEVITSCVFTSCVFTQYGQFFFNLISPLDFKHFLKSLVTEPLISLDIS